MGMAGDDLEPKKYVVHVAMFSPGTTTSIIAPFASILVVIVGGGGGLGCTTF